ncbi:MAG: hypothetical protein ABH824_05460 [Nanoarchaeota archaeon]
MEFEKKEELDVGMEDVDNIFLNNEVRNKADVEDKSEVKFNEDKTADKKSKSHKHKFFSRKKEDKKKEKKENYNEEKQTHHSNLGKDITIKLNPKKLIKWALLILIFIAVFYLGRFSVTASSCELSSFTDFFSNFASKLESASDAGSSSVVADNEIVKGSDSEVGTTISKEAEVEETDGSSETSEETTKVTETVQTTKTTSTNNEKIVTSYNKVVLSLDGVYIDWKDTWGKITGINYTIKNNEAGTIKPDYFTMIVEGYDDFEKKFDVHYSTQTVKSGITAKDSTAVSGGFAYNEVSAGDLKNVKIQLFLYDSSDNLIASVSKDMDLNGE